MVSFEKVILKGMVLVKSYTTDVAEGVSLNGPILARQQLLKSL